MYDKNGQILLAEDDLSLGYLLVENLQGKGFDVVLAKTGAAALEAIQRDKFNLCILDIMMPGIDGFALAGHIKQRQPETPFIFLTARNMEKDKLRGFEAGADDYLTKPFSFRELHYRILVTLRRAFPTQQVVAPNSISFGSLQFHPTDRILSVYGKDKKLTQREAAILQMLLQQSGTFVSRGEMLRKIWGNDDYFTGKSMDVYITRVRKLLKDDPTIELENLYGTGYRIKNIEE